MKTPTYHTRAVLVDYQSEKAESWKMFNAISARYDLLNHLLSFGLDIFWRKKLIQRLPRDRDLKVVDLATGTADVLIALTKSNPNVTAGYGIDLAENMLALGRAKIGSQGLQDKLTLERADAHRLPFADQTLDCATIAFGIRNMHDPSAVLSEMGRVLKGGGRALILEFSLPRNVILRQLHLFYLRTVVPGIGGLISGHREAYLYLNKTIEAFPYGPAFGKLMQEAGFVDVKVAPLMAGIATIYEGTAK